jgi:hypothetical protein
MCPIVWLGSGFLPKVIPGGSEDNAEKRRREFSLRYGEGRRTGAIVYAYAVDKKSTIHGQQTTAEACAKHLEAHIERHE